MAKAPTPGSTRPDAPKPMFEFGFGDRRWHFRLTEVTPRDSADVRAAVGMGAKDLFAALVADSLDIDIAAGLVFLARRQSENPRIPFDAAVDGLTYSTPFHWGVVEDNGDPE